MMKSRFFCVILIVLFTLTFSNCTHSPDSDLTHVHWMLGEWKSGETGFIESWELVDGKMKGRGMDVSNSDTAIFEYLQILYSNGKLIYVANVEHNDEPIEFISTEVVENKIVFENPAHDFPQKITYSKLNDDEIMVIVEGSGKTLKLNLLSLK